MLTRRRVLGLAGAAGLAGCVGPGGAPTSTATTPPTTPAAHAARLAATLAAALASGDEAAFVRGFADPLRTQAAVVFANARAMAQFTLDEEGEHLLARWRAGAGRDPVVDRFSAGVDAAGRVTSLRPRSTTGPPVWWRHRVRVAADERASLVATSSRAGEAAPWLAAASAAVGHLHAARLEPWASAWDGTLTVLVPEDLLDFGLGAGTGAYATTAPVGQAGTVTLNPARLAVGDEADRLGLLLHEGVHVVTRSGDSPAPLWAMEGLAEWVATSAWPAASAANRSLVAEVLRGNLPASLPTPTELAAPGQDGSRAYALAEVAVEASLGRWGREKVFGWFATWPPDRPPDSAFTDAYLSALRRRSGR